MTQDTSRNRATVVRFLIAYGFWALLGATLGGFIGLALGGPGPQPQGVDGIVPATEWSDYVAHSWVLMLIGGLVGALVFVAVVKCVKDRRRAT